MPCPMRMCAALPRIWAQFAPTTGFLWRSKGFRQYQKKEELKQEESVKEEKFKEPEAVNPKAKPKEISEKTFSRHEDEEEPVDHIVSSKPEKQKVEDLM